MKKVGTLLVPKPVPKDPVRTSLMLHGAPPRGSSAQAGYSGRPVLIIYVSHRPPASPRPCEGAAFDCTASLVPHNLRMIRIHRCPWGRARKRMIEIEGLTKTYGAVRALDGLTLSVGKGEVFGLLGPNGAGKTTTLKIFTDLIRPSSGHAFINGANVHTHKKKALASVGTVIETPEIYPSLTPREALGMVADLRGVPHAERRKRIEEVCAEVGMHEWIDKRGASSQRG